MKQFMQRPISEFRIVDVYHKSKISDVPRLDSHSNSYIVHYSQLERLIEAQKELHYIPGINPANKNKTAVIYEIKIGPFREDGPFWWSTPGLAGNDDPKGAVILSQDMVTFWRHPEYQAQLDKEEDEMYRTESEG